MDNLEMVQKGFRLLHKSLADFLYREIKKKYPRDWWKTVLIKLNDQYDLPMNGSDEELVNSLDLANCLRLFDRISQEILDYKTAKTCNAWEKELMGLRNRVAHFTSGEMTLKDAQRALDTMTLFSSKLKLANAEVIEEIYHELQYKDISLSEGGATQPRGRGLNGILLDLIGTDDVQKTNLTRKITFNGTTETYPVYRVRLDLLYYNDRNDRIATWLSQYKAENGEETLTDLGMEDFNSVIEGFITESNPDALNNTKRSIKLRGQQVSGVSLSDGRIVDGNRRFTCLRCIERENGEPQYFETVILDQDAELDLKQIKLLELAIQHGEEKKVDYSPIEHAVGTYLDVEKNGTVSVQEYAQYSNEPESEVRKRISIAKLVVEFLDYLGLQEQYFIARDYQVYSLFSEMLPLLKKLSPAEGEQLKRIAFNNAVLGEKDRRKFIRDIKTLVSSKSYEQYFAQQELLGEKFRAAMEDVSIESKTDLDFFSSSQSELAGEMRKSIEDALLAYRGKKLASRPAEMVNHSISGILDLDRKLLEHMDEDEKAALRGELDRLAEAAEALRAEIAGESDGMVYRLSEIRPEDVQLLCTAVRFLAMDTAAVVELTAVSAGDSGRADCRVFLADYSGKAIGEEQILTLEVGESELLRFELPACPCRLVVQKADSPKNEALFVLALR